MNQQDSTHSQVIHHDEQQLNNNTEIIEVLQNFDGILQKTNIQIEFKNENVIEYTLNRKIIRREIIMDLQVGNQIMKNLEQIKYLSWEGEYNYSKKKVGLWRAKWQGIPIDIGGYYSDQGHKQGKWKDLHINFWEQSKIIENGEYINGKRVGFWKYMLDHQIIGIGNYDQDGNQNGLWIQPIEKFYKYTFLPNRQTQIFYSGKYREGIKIGRWITYLQNFYHNYRNQKEIGCGDYDQNGIKQGQWVELHENFSQKCQVQYQGEYKNGIKQGDWVFKRSNQNQQNIILGGGSYDQDGKKHGKWTDLHEYFSITKQFILTGEYEHGIKKQQFEESEL